MSAYQEEVAAAANWLWDRKDRTATWNWVVLSAGNPDPETLGYSNVLSFQVFAILQKKGLIEPYSTEQPNGVTISGFHLCLDDQAKWKAVRFPPVGLRRFKSVVLMFFGGAWRLLLWALSILGAVYLTHIAEDRLEPNPTTPQETLPIPP